MIETYVEDEIIGQRLIPGLTPDFILSQLKQSPMITHHWKKNTEQNQQRFIDVMMRIPSRSDCPGFIYGFRQKNGYNSQDQNYEIKLGRTKRLVPQKRIFEWEKADEHEYNQIFTARSQYNVKLQALIHLIFAYARKIITINGNRRIQWFEFKEKVATAAITNLINLLMEKIHQKFIDNIQDAPACIYYQQLIERISRKYYFVKENVRLVAFGLPKTGKTVFGHLLMEGDKQILVEQTKNGLSLKKIELQKSSYVQVSDNWQNLSELESLQKYFSIWQNLCLSDKIIPILVVKQSDIESSLLTGLSQGLTLLQKYIKPDNRMMIVVSKSSKQFGQQNAIEAIQDCKMYIKENQFKLLADSQFILIKSPQSTGPFLGKKQIEKIKQRFTQITDKIYGEKQKWGTVQFKIQKEHLSFCHQIIQKSYQILQNTYAQIFSKKYLQYIEQDMKIDLLKEISQILMSLTLAANQQQQVIHKIITKLMDILQMPQKIRLQTYLYIFCQFCANKSIAHTMIMSGLSQKIQEKISQITEYFIIKLSEELQTFKNAITTYIHKNQREYVPQFKQILQLTNLKQMEQIFKQIINKGKGRKEEQIVSLLLAIEEIVSTIHQMNTFIVKGFRFDSSLGLIRQSIYYGLKGQLPQHEVKQEEFNQQTAEQREKEKEKEEVQIEHSQENCHKMSDLLQKTAEYREGNTIINIIDQFIIDSPSKLSLKHNLFIFAKSVKVYTEFNITFSSLNKHSTEKKPLKFIIVSEKYENMGKIKASTKSTNGDFSLLTLQDNEIRQINASDNMKKHVNKQFLQQLRKVHKSKLK